MRRSLSAQPPSGSCWSSSPLPRRCPQSHNPVSGPIDPRRARRSGEDRQGAARVPRRRQGPAHRRQVGRRGLDGAGHRRPGAERPRQHEPPKERTVVQVAYDDRLIYVAACCYMTDPSTITTALGRRDTIPRSDMIRITFDPRHDHLTAYTFDVNPSGVQGDMTWFDDTRSSTDYDAVWEVRTRSTARAGRRSFAFRSRRCASASSPAKPCLGLQHPPRHRRHRGGRSLGGDASRRQRIRVALRAPDICHAAGAAAPARISAVRRSAQQEHTTGAGSDQGLSGGVDMRMGLGTSATLSATVNPDFGQVEQDPAVLNLSVFETFFPEKRPFFIEDSRTSCRHTFR